MSVRTERAICLGFHKDISAVFCYYRQLGHAISIKIVSVHRHTLTMKAHVVCSKRPCQRFVLKMKTSGLHWWSIG